MKTYISDQIPNNPLLRPSTLGQSSVVRYTRTRGRVDFASSGKSQRTISDIECEPMKPELLTLSCPSRRCFLSQLGLGTITACIGHDARADHPPPFTQVPAEFSGLQPDLRSTLVFNDGSTVKSADDWNKRRTEILSDWHRIMGEWPPMVDHPSIEINETTMRGNVKQQRVRVQIAPDQTSDGYILIPPGDGPFPAVFVPFYDPETSIGLSDKPFRGFAWQLSRRGFVSFSIGAPGGDASKPVLSEQAHCQPLS